MNVVKIAVVGVGGISQIFRIPTLKKMEEVNLVALCDVDETKVSVIANKFDIPKVYYDVQNMLKNENIDAVLICTPNNLHFPMALACLEKGIATLVEKPLALNISQTEKLVEKAKSKNVPLVVGMNNRFREDAIILKDFIEKDEIGTPFYIKAGWIKGWGRQPQQRWMSDIKIAGGGVIMDLGIQLVDLALWFLNKPKLKNIHTYSFHINTDQNIEDSALVVIETKNNITITIEISWGLHIEKDMHYFHIFGNNGAAFMNPPRINKEIHGNLVNVTPMLFHDKVELIKKTYENELGNFVSVIKGIEEPISPGEDAIYLMKILNVIYESARTGKPIDL
jgi:predicted dehydrogenase